MATPISTLTQNARITLLELSARFWTDAELLTLANEAIKDLWKGIIDLYQDHIVTIDDTNVTLSASSSTLSGVPADVFRVVMIQPRVVGENSAAPSLIFKPRTLTHPDFVQAQAQRAIAPRDGIIYYATINAGAPVGAPSIRVAPQITSAINLSLWYNPTIANKIGADNNPIPGESDKAIQEYIIAFARAKEREDRSPDPEHLSIYATEKRNLLVALTPRSVQEPEVVNGFWEGYDSTGDWNG